MIISNISLGEKKMSKVATNQTLKNWILFSDQRKLPQFFYRQLFLQGLQDLDEPYAPKGTHVFDQSNHDKKSTKQTKQELYHILSSLSIVSGC